MQKLHIKLTDLLAVVPERKLFVARKSADNRRFNIFGGEKFGNGVEILLFHRDDHSLLRFAYPNLGIIEPSVL